MQKKSPRRFWPAGGFDDDERTVDIASTIYILAYFQTKFKFIFHYLFHFKNSIKLFASYDREDDGTITFGDRTMIPLPWVKKMTRI